MKAGLLIVTTFCICFTVAVVALVVALTRQAPQRGIGRCATGVQHVYREVEQDEFGNVTGQSLIVLCKNGEMFKT